MVNPEFLQEHAQRIRVSGVLGRSALLARLFDFFVSCSLKGYTPKEIEVALDVFGKRADFDVAQDAVVRVYIHKLRRKLDEYYAGPGKEETGRLVIPKGEYRFVWQSLTATDTVETEPPVSDSELAGETDLALESIAAEQARLLAQSVNAPSVSQNPLQRRPVWLIASLLVLVLVANVVLFFWQSTQLHQSAQLRAVRAHPLWAHMLDDDLPIFVVVGDYYIFGELDPASMDVQRLVREFDINSATDLETHLKNNPQLADRYMDMSLQYLPISVADALRNVMPVLEPNGKRSRQVRVVLASELTPAMVKSAHVVYLGLLSGMGVLKELVLSQSPIRIGDTFDELIDHRTGQHYITQAGELPDNKDSYTDYGFVYSLTAKEGTQILVLAGTRDVSLMHVAEVLTHEEGLQQLDQQLHGSSDFEALYAVRALDRTNLSGRLLVSYPLQRGVAAAANRSAVNGP